jgi:hypothetical protein
VNEVVVQDLGPRTWTDESGEENVYYSVSFTLEHEGTTYGQALSLSPGVEPGDPEYVLAVENSRRTFLAKALQEIGDDPAE